MQTSREQFDFSSAVHLVLGVDLPPPPPQGLIMFGSLSAHGQCVTSGSSAPGTVLAPVLEGKTEKRSGSES